MHQKPITGFPSKALALILAAMAGHSAAAPTPGAGFGIETAYTHTSPDNIVSFDRDAQGNLYYMTSPNFLGLNLWKSSGGAPESFYSSSNFVGVSVVTIGDYVYFNDGDSSFTTYIRSYGPLSGTPGLSQLSTASNYSLHAQGGALFVTGFSGTGNHIFYSSIGAGGSLVESSLIDLGSASGNSGPLGWDAAGNMYFAPGFSDTRIYKWSAGEVAAAIANPLADALNISGHVWLDYSLLYPEVDGASSLGFDESGDLVITLTNNVPGTMSYLTKFGVGDLGAHDGSNTVMLSDTNRLLEVRTYGDGLYVSNENKIYRVVPEPGSAVLLAGSLSLLLIARRRAVTSLRQPA